MLTYTLGGLAAITLGLVAAFAVVAWRNDGASAGPPVAVTVRVDAAGVEPGRVEAERGRLIELRLVNGTGETLILSGAGAVEQLPPNVEGYDPHAPSEPFAYISIAAGPGQENAAYVRFEEAGDHQLSIATRAGAPGGVVTVSVR